MAKDVINKYKKQNMAGSKKALRKTLKQESDNSTNAANDITEVIPNYAHTNLFIL